MNYAKTAIKTGRSNLDIDPINPIGNRASLYDYNEGKDGHDIWEELKLQRRLEFAFEVPGQRYA